MIAPTATRPLTIVATGLTDDDGLPMVLIVGDGLFVVRDLCEVAS